MKKILPLVESPITTFPCYAGPVGAILAECGEKDWLYNCFIQITSWDNQFLDFYDFTYKNCPLIEYQRIKGDLINSFDVNIVEFIANALDKGYYVVASVETKYINEYSFDGVHDLTIFGHEDRESFYTADCFKDGYFTKIKVDGETLRRALSGINDSSLWKNHFNGTIDLYSIKKAVSFKIDLDRITESIMDYLKSAPTSRWYPQICNWDEAERQKRTFGIECYQTLIKHLNSFGEGVELEGSIKAFHLMWQHKKFMTQRILYMSDNKLCGISQAIIEELKKEEKLSRKVLMLLLKNKTKPDNGIVKRVHAYIEELKKRECDNLSEIMESIKRG